jgi:hypothetical protein
MAMVARAAAVARQDRAAPVVRELPARSPDAMAVAVATAAIRAHLASAVRPDRPARVVVRGHQARPVPLV